ncbi:hypothetical protein C9439_00885 [archaeon SCG-AAA382B04]|nr:hypothetical protein C9439_00885 [archaeon SCG-AAA382B04]
MAGELEYFKQKVSGTDKIMQSFVIGGVLLIYSMITAGISSFSPMTITKLLNLMGYYVIVWIGAILFIQGIIRRHHS